MRIFALPLLWTQIALALSVFWLSEAQATLGETVAEAKSHARTYRNLYGACCPLFQTDTNGKVIWECWAAPPEQWTKHEVMHFARLLIPKDMASKSPKKGAIEGDRELYYYPDGTVVSLTFTNIAIPRTKGIYYGVEVHSPSYTGYFC